jgi:hypothetical protein
MSVLGWQEVPSVVEAKDENGTHKIELSLKFQELIDLVAMRRGLAGTDSYLMEWSKTAYPERDQDAKIAAEALAAEIESRYEEIKSEALAKSSGD